MPRARRGEDLAAATAKVGPKGQIVIPKEVRDLFGIESGDTVLVMADRARGIAVVPVRGDEDLFGRLFGAAMPDGVPAAVPGAGDDDAASGGKGPR